MKNKFINITLIAFFVICAFFIFFVLNGAISGVKILLISQFIILTFVLFVSVASQLHGSDFSNLFHSKKKIFPLVSIAIVNTSLFLGVWLFDWSFKQILFVSWIEIVIVGVLNIPKICLSRKSDNEFFKFLQKPKRIDSKNTAIAYFLASYLLFIFISGIFLLAMGGEVQLNFGLLAVIISVFVSHLVSFVVYFVLIPKEKRETMSRQIEKPFQRTIASAVIIVVSSFLLMGGGFGGGMQVLLGIIFFKMIFDIISHYKEHNKSAILRMFHGKV